MKNKKQNKLMGDVIVSTTDKITEHGEDSIAVLFKDMSYVERILAYTAITDASLQSLLEPLLKEEYQNKIQELVDLLMSAPIGVLYGCILTMYESTLEQDNINMQPLVELIDVLSTMKHIQNKLNISDMLGSLSSSSNSADTIH